MLPGVKQSTYFHLVKVSRKLSNPLKYHSSTIPVNVNIGQPVPLLTNITVQHLHTLEILFGFSRL